ncbi:MAG: YfcC family protein [Alkalispirochaetaceae bacterium]
MSSRAGEASSIKIGKRAFFFAGGIILTLMILSGILTRLIPAGRYDRVLVDGRIEVVTGSFRYVEQAPYPIYRWFTAPVEVLFAEGNITLITIILFLVFVGGAFTVLERAQILSAFLTRVVHRFRHRRFLLMAVVQLFFMLCAAVLGIFEAMVPLIVFVVPLAHMLGWDSLTGLGMSLLPLAFGFSAAVTNPFTIGVAQTIAELPLFSGAWLRIIFFLIVYLALLLFVRSYARRLEREPGSSLVWKEDAPLRELHAREVGTPVEPLPAHLSRALRFFGTTMAIAVLFIILSSRVPSISVLAFPVMALLFLVGGIGSGLLCGRTPRWIGRTLLAGAAQMLPGAVLVMMAMSVKHIVDNGGITDTVLYLASRRISEAGPLGSAFLIYAVTLGMNFFIGSASAKAFLMMPILTPLADLVGVTRQTAVLAFGFGDGFSNVVYPTNALLLIALSLTVVSYPRWIRWTLPLQLLMLGMSALVLALAVRVGYGPF